MGTHILKYFVIFALSAIVLVEAERPKAPIITTKAIHPTSVEIQVQLVEQAFGGRSVYSNCVGHAVHLKLKDEPDDAFKLVKIVDKDGGFLLEGLEPKTAYHIRVACKAKAEPGAAPSVGDWSHPNLRVVTPDFGADDKDGSDKDGSGNLSSLSSLHLFAAAASILIALN